MTRQLYRVHGLVLSSPIALTELAPAADGAAPDITVEWNGAPDERALTSYHFTVPDAASFRVEDGRRIIISPAPAPDMAAVRLFLLGSAMGVLLHQRGAMVLHANAIVVNGRAIAFTGPSGAGKSTLATAFAQKGYPVLADDVAVVVLDESGQPWVEPGSQRVRLWGEAAAALAVGSDHPRVKADMDKYTVPLATPAGERVPFARLYVLESPSDEWRITPVSGSAAVNTIIANTYRGFMVGELGASEAHWRNALAIATRIRVAAVPRAASFADLPAMVAAIAAEG